MFLNNPAGFVAAGETVSEVSNAQVAGAKKPVGQVTWLVLPAP
jgi:hypothetical protein